jgi:hypothetical protein
MRTPKAHQSTALPYFLSKRICDKLDQVKHRKEMNATDLWSHEFRCATECACRRAVPHLLLAQSIITNLDMTVKGQQNVIQLQVPVDDAVLVEVLKRKTNFGGIESARR